LAENTGVADSVTWEDPLKKGTVGFQPPSGKKKLGKGKGKDLGKGKKNEFTKRAHSGATSPMPKVPRTQRA